MRTFILASVVLVVATPAFAQGVAPGQRGTDGAVVQRQPNATGNDRDVVISRGGTGADTVTTNSAAGGNAAKPEQAVPNGSANGGGGSGQ